MSGQANWGGYEVPAAPARSRRAGWWSWGVILVLIFTLALCAGCATLPPCPIPHVDQVETEDDGTLYVFDELNFVLEMQRLLGVAEGTCRLTPKGAI